MVNNKYKITRAVDEKFKNSEGLDLERSIIKACSYYYKNNLAFIKKTPAPSVFNKKHGVVYDGTNKSKMVDFVGVYKSRFIAIEAKSTNEPARLPLKNITKEQIEYLKDVKKFGGLAYFIIQFKTSNVCFKIDASYIIEQYEQKEGCSSVSYGYVMENGDYVNYKDEMLDFLGLEYSKNNI